MNARQHRMLIGSDIELMPAAVQTGQLDINWWREWINKSSTIPPKGERRELSGGYWMHRDGLSIEYGIPPSSCAAEFLHHINTGRDTVQQELGEPLIAVDWFNVGVLVADPLMEQHLEMGCSPDFQVVGSNGETVQRSIPTGVREEGSRECGGHIHISLPQEYLNDPILKGVFIRHLDDMVYPMFNLNTGDYRSWYRHRRVFRSTPYGVEYRSLGAESLFDENITRNYIEAVFDITSAVWGK